MTTAPKPQPTTTTEPTLAQFHQYHRDVIATRGSRMDTYETTPTTTTAEPKLTQYRMDAIAASVGTLRPRPREKGEPLIDCFLRQLLAKGPCNGETVMLKGLNAGFKWMRLKRSATKLEIVRKPRNGWYAPFPCDETWSLPGTEGVEGL
jgi:hypothetical protein